MSDTNTASVAKAIDPLTVDDPGKLLIPVKDYACKPLPEAFENLDEVLVPLLKNGGAVNYDVTVFYSKREGLSKEKTEAMLMHNQRAFEAARRMGGLIIYFQGPLLNGVKDTDRSPKLDLDFAPDCMSFCIWQSNAHAKAGSHVPEHRAAAAGAREWYTYFAIAKLEASVQTVATVEGEKETVAFRPIVRQR